MSSSSKRNVKVRKPRVLANIVKKPGKNFNNSGNNSFLNHSKNLFIESLRSNNTKLAHSLEKEKQRTAQLFKENLTNKNIILTQKSALRTISNAVKDGVNKFKGALDLLIDASSTFFEIKEKITSFCPELEEDVCPAPPQHERVREPTGNVESRGTPAVFPSTNSVNSSTIAPQGPTPGGPSSRYGITRPMVQGQVISNPVISLQRVVVPHHTLGRGVMAPVRGGMNLSQLSASAARRPFSRLSDVAEEGNGQGSEDSGPTSTEVISLSTSIAATASSILSTASTVSPAVSTISSSIAGVSSSGSLISDFFPTSSNISLPGSHVLLERLPAIITEQPQSVSSQLCEEDQEQLTVVHFGSLGFSSETLITSPAQPKETSSCNQVPQDSPSLLNDSSQCSSESSEDEDLALQIVESKRQYLERSRQADSKEGTSWNYDDAGKFHSRPPKKRKGKKNNSNSVKRSRPEAKRSSQKINIKESCRPELNLECRGSESEVLPSGKKSNEITSNHESSMAPKVCPLSPILPTKTEDSTDILSITNLESLDMSFTACVTSPTCISDALEAKRKEVPEEEPQQDNRLQVCDRNIHVTQRSRGRKQDHECFPEKVEFLDGKSNNAPSSLVPVVRLKDSNLENNENFPPSSPRGSFSDSPIPSHDKIARSTNSTNLKDLTQSFVVLERLPDDSPSVSSFRLSESEVSFRPSNKYEKKRSSGLESPISVDVKAEKQVGNMPKTRKHTLPLSSHSTSFDGSVNIQNSKLLTKQREEGKNLERNSAGRENAGSLQSTPPLSSRASSTHQTKEKHELRQQPKSAVLSPETGSPLRKRKLHQTQPVNQNSRDSSSSESEDIFESKSKPRPKAKFKDLKKDSYGNKVSLRGSSEAKSNLEGTKKGTVLPSVPIVKLNDQEWDDAGLHFMPLKKSRIKKKSAGPDSEAGNDDLDLPTSSSSRSQSGELSTFKDEVEGRQSDSVDGHRPRRNVAPKNFKEPHLNTKMRRP